VRSRFHGAARQLMRILHVAALPFPSRQGTQVSIRQMVERQARRGHEVHLLTYAHGEENFSPEGYRVHRLADFPVFRSMRSGPSWRKVVLDARMAAAVERLVRSLSPDLVHAHHYEALAASLLGNLGRRPVLYHAHTLLGPELPTYASGRLAKTAAARLGLEADRFLPSLAGACAAISPALAEMLVARGVPAGRVFVVPPALEVEPRGRPARGRHAVAADLVYAGNLDGYQGIEAMLEGMAELARTGRRPSLKIVTDSATGKHAALARQLGIAENVSFEPHGDFAGVAGRIQSSSIAVAPRSIPGGFSMKLINYLRLGKPVLASPHGSGGLEDGREILVFETPRQFAAAAGRLLDDAALRQRVARAGARRAAELFLWPEALDVLDEVYRELLRRRT
jgi:glycosyltransferase involved in cell wall biosynthesis